MRKLAFIFFTAVWFFGLTRVVVAQEPEAAPAAQTDTAVLQRESLTAEIAQLETIYRGQLTEYRAAEREYQIARDQYHALQTLASIDAVVTQAQRVLRLRTQVMLTYFELLRTHLLAADGVEITLKQTVLQRIEEQKAWLQNHQAELSAASDREQLNGLSDAFTARQEVLEGTAHEANVLLATGKLQNVFDRLRLLTDDVKVQEASNSAFVNSRALVEVDRLTTAVSGDLTALRQDITKGIAERDVRILSQDLTRVLDPIYANLNKLTSFLTEVLRTL